MVVVVEYPIAMHINNVGSIFLSEKTYTPQLTNHIDVCHHFICDYVEDRTVEIYFFRSEENMAYPFTKKLSNGPFGSLTSSYVHREQYLNISLSLFQSHGGKASHVIEEGCYRVSKNILGSGHHMMNSH